MDPYLYLDRNTFVHRLDPRTKIILMFGSFILGMLFMHPLWIAPALVLVLAHGAAGRVLSNLRRIWWILFMLATMGTILWALFSGGPTPFLGPIEWEAFLFGLGSALRINTMIIAGMVFLSTTRNEEIVLGMVMLGVPYRFGFALSTALRLVPTIAATVATISQAQRSRGLDLDSGNAIQRLKKNIPLVVPAFLSTIRSTNVFGMALDSKGFGARPQRTNYLQVRFGAADVALLAVLLALLVPGICMWVLKLGRIPGLTRF
ncbi:MAG: energy-coupling factor transporter transmembrane component T family protein [Anaerolineae bacterium]